MNDQQLVYTLAGLIALVLAIGAVRKSFDPFAPVWLFLVGYFHVYVIQPISLREWALTVRGADVVTEANFRALWALPWFLAVYYSGIGKAVASRLPRPPGAWSVGAVLLSCPVLLAWGFYCTWTVIVMEWAADLSDLSAEEALFRSFPFLMMVAGILLIISGRQPSAPRPLLLAAGLAVASAYVVMWMYNGKRSHSVIGVLSTVAAWYITRRKRPSWPVLLSTAFAGSMVVAGAIGWRNNINYERSVSGFLQYAADFRVASILTSLNIEDGDDEEGDVWGKPKSYETLEYGGFLLMMDTVPEKSEFDYGANYLRVISTFIPRIIWPDKPLYGREQWVKAWQAGSELKRDDSFTGPAIGILGACQLNGGATGTLIVLAVVALLLRTSYEYFILYDAVPWVQAWWALSYFNAWLMVVADDPMNWFYYNWGVTCFPILVFLWITNRLFPRPSAEL
jgi:hypothetical protein